MDKPGPLVASGRDADIFEYRPGLVLRRSRAGRSMAAEARIMTYLHDAGFPVPAVEEISEDGLDLVIERIDGPSMVELLSRKPWTIRQQARRLAELHARLHEVPAPDFLPASPWGHGPSVLHLDLHPLNVMVGAKGPVVIDWTGACVGDGDMDVGLAWVLLASGQIPANGVMTKVLATGRRLFVNGFTGQFDRQRIAGKLRAIVEWKVQDLHMSKTEVAGMWRLVEQVEGGRPG